MDADVDVEEVSAQLYGLPPDRFTEARDEQAARARKAGDQQAAKTIAGLRRPTLAAFASNLLVRERPRETAALLELGRALREAHQALHGPQLRELSHRQHGVVSELARTARQLAGEAGSAVSDTVLREVEQTLHAALADPDAAEQWASGRLSRALEPPVGFTGLPPVEPGPRPERAPAPDAPPPPSGTPAPARVDARRLARLERARQAARETGDEAEAREGELRAAVEEQERCEEAAAEAEEHLAEAERRLREVREAQRSAREAVVRSAARVRDLERAAKQARRAADAAAARLGELSPG
ncbi:hypothetical protein ABZ128_25080 [Streptomyces sp. NPDC006326]|uniref:hypothetical protein n=1 Tax=Streptomyces sp. NPDC006326 TaxID=3156752 RepID=UPI00339EEEE8